MTPLYLYLQIIVVVFLYYITFLNRLGKAELAKGGPHHIGLNLSF